MLSPASIILIVAALSHGSVLAAQSPKAPEPEFLIAADGDTVFMLAGVDKPVGPGPLYSRLEYPPGLRRRNVEGEVLVEYVVDTLGRMMPSTFKVLKSTDPQFDRSVRNFLRDSRFIPAERKGRKVRQLVQQPFNFQLGFR
jgi:protein TonB